MTFDLTKRIFLNKIAPGIRALFSDTKESNRIGRNPSNHIEHFLKKNILIHTDEDDIFRLLTFFDSINITFGDVFREADINILYLTEDEIRIKTLIDNGDIATFNDFVCY